MFRALLHLIKGLEGPGPRHAVMEECEPRILYSADLNPALWIDAHGAAAQVAMVDPPATATVAAQTPAEQELQERHRSREIVFVDAHVADSQKLIDAVLAQRGAQADIEIVSIESSRSGLQQITEVLSGERNLSAIHIISHGSAGQLQLGNGTVDAQTLNAKAASLNSWRAALTADADILLYGCDVAAGAQGQDFIEQLAQVTGADVAASTDATGNATQGGDWELESSIGIVEAVNPFELSGAAHWQGLLAAPTFTNLAGSTLTYTENDAGTAVDSGLTLSDADSTNLASATVTVSANFATAEDTLAFTNQSGITGSWNAGTGVMTLSGSATVAQYQTALRSITYVNSSDNPSTATRTVSFVVNDGSANSNTGTRNISVTAVNDAPVVTTTGTTLAYTENAAATAIDSGVTLSDVDNTNLASATVTVSANFATAEDTLAFTNQSGITGSWNSGTGVMTLSGSATVAQYQTALRSITYVNSSENPSTATRTVSFVVNDGSANSSTATRDISVTAANDAPTFAVGNGIVTTAVGSGNDLGLSATVQADGKILVAGSSYNGSNDDFALTRYNTDGSLDTSFSGDGKLTTAVGSGNDVGRSVTVQADGKILVAGVGHNGSNDDFALIRYNTDGSLDTSFSGDGILTTAVGSGNDNGMSVTLQADGKILVAGVSHNGSYNNFGLTRYNTDGSLDTSFSGDGKLITAVGSGNDFGRSVTVQADGKILVAGYSHNGSNNDVALTRYNTDGSLDTSFSGDGILTTAVGSGNDYGFGVTLQADGKILVSGASNNGSNDDFALTRYNTDGSLDTSFSGDGKLTTAVGSGNDYGLSVTVQADGKILVAGYGHNGSNNDFALTRYNTDGSLDTSFSGDGILTTAVGSGNDFGRSVTVQADGKILVAGYSNNGSNDDFALTRYNTDGSLDTSSLNNIPIYTENGAAVVLDSDVQVYDTELSAADNFSGATLTLVRNGGASSQDVYSATGTLSSISAASGNVVVSGTTIGTYTNSAGTLVFTFNASATNARVNSAMQQIAYANSSDAPPSSVQINWTLNDGNSGAQGSGGALTGTGSITVSITAVNDAPVVTTTGSTLTYTENDAGTAVDSGLTLSDADSTNMTGATVTVSANFVSGQDVLAFTNQSGITGSWNSGTGVLTLTGSATVAQYQTALRSITYVNSSDNPSTATRTVSFVVNDGTDPSTPGTRNISVAAANDAPTFAVGNGIVTTAVGSGNDLGLSATVQADGKILVAGSSYNGSNDDFALTRYNTDGSLDTSFSGDGKLTTAVGSGNDVGRSVTVQADGKILVAGVGHNGSNDDFALIRYNTDGSLDTSFSGDGILTTAVGSGNDYGMSVTLQADGKILVAGVSHNGSYNNFALTRYNTDGSLPESVSR